MASPVVYDLVVIGGGPAGLRAAHRAREHGALTAIVGMGAWGGTAVNDGVVPARTLAQAARLLRDLREQCPRFGIEVGSVNLNLATLMGAVRQTIDEVHTQHRYSAALQEKGADVFLVPAPAYFLDARRIQAGDQMLEGRKFLLCTGGRARQIEFPGSDLTIGHRELWSMTSLPARVAVIGGSATGCQVASILAALGARVTVLEMMGRVLGPEDEAVSQKVEERFQERGLEVVTSMKGVDRIQRAGNELELTYRIADGPRTLRVETVFLSVGWVANTDSLDLSAAGVQTERGFVKVNEFLQSSAAHVYAAGDVNGRMMLAQSAKVQADIATDNALTGSQREYHPWLVAQGGYTDPEYAGVGPTETQARQAHECEVETVHYREIICPVVDGRADGFCKLIVDRTTHKVLAAHAVGDHATDIVQVVAGALAGETTVEELGALELAYPTYSSVVRVAASRIAVRLGARPSEPERVPPAGAKLT